MIIKNPDYSILKEKKRSCDNDFKSFDINEKIPGERMRSNKVFFLLFKMSSIKICFYADENDIVEREK